MKRLSVLCLLLVVVGSAAIAQDKTPTPEPETPQFAFEFPLAHSTAEQIEAAYACELDPEAAEAWTLIWSRRRPVRSPLPRWRLPTAARAMRSRLLRTRSRCSLDCSN
ncbi:MAG: hypothetical protein HND48_21200 [Chloroflexi bacterium]|nr:hypothetical protein [Chloroflexota bacterium]